MVYAVCIDMKVLEYVVWINVYVVFRSIKIFMDLVNHEIYDNLYLTNNNTFILYTSFHDLS